MFQLGFFDHKQLQKRGQNMHFDPDRFHQVTASHQKKQKKKKAGPIPTVEMFTV